MLKNNIYKVKDLLDSTGKTGFGRLARSKSIITVEMSEN